MLAMGLFGQEEAEISEINTDRPTQSISPYTLPKGYFQVESGFDYKETKIFFIDPFNPVSPGIPMEGKVQNITYNNLVLRYGLSRNIELRFTQDVFNARVRADGRTFSELGTEAAPTSFGLKARLFREKGSFPAISASAFYATPVFSDISGETTQLRLNFAHSAKKRISIAYNLGIDFINNQGIGYERWFYTAMASYSIVRGVSAFGEVYGAFPEFFENTHQGNVGIMYAIKPNFQVDGYCGFPLSDASTDLILGFGFSWRFPKG